MTKGSTKRKTNRSPTFLSKDGSPSGGWGNKKDHKSQRRTPRGRRVFFAPQASDDIHLASPAEMYSCRHKSHFNDVTHSTSLSQHPSARNTPQLHRRKSKPVSGHKASSSNKRWKQLLFKRLRAKDLKILHFLKSRPPPPTVGPSGRLALTCEESNNSDHTNDVECTFPEPYNEWFDQGGRKDNIFGDNGGIEVDAEELRKPTDKSSPPQCRASPVQCAPSLLAAASTVDANDHSLDLFGSYLQDYKQSDCNKSLFDENMFLG